MFYTDIGNILEKETEQNMHVFASIENVDNVQPSVENELKMQDIQTMPRPTFAQLSHLPFVSTHSLPFVPTPFILQGELHPQGITPLQLHRTQQMGQRKPCCFNNPGLVGLSFGENTFLVNRNQFQQQYLQMTREELSRQQQVLCQNQIVLLREQLRLRRQQITRERVQQQQLQTYGRTKIISSQIKLFRKIQELRMVQVRSLQQQLAHQQNFLRTQAVLQYFKTYNTILQNLQYWQIQKFKEELSRLQRFLAQNKAIIQRTEAKRNHCLDLQRRLEAEIEHLKREQINNTTRTLTTTKSGSF